MIKNKDNITSKRVKMIKRFSVIFFLLSVLTGSLLILFYYNEFRTDRGAIEKIELHGVELQERMIMADFRSIVSDLNFLAGQNDLQRMLINKKPGHRQALAREYLRFCEKKGLYDQIRFLDETGVEIVRVNFNSGHPFDVSEEELQSKAKRYYFKDTLALDRGEVFVSPFDLNIEQGIIEQPFKPMIRFGTPVFDGNGQKRGIVVLNYLGEQLIQNFKGTSVYSEGFWLIGNKPGDEWRIMYEDSEDLSVSPGAFGIAFPNAWPRISGAESGQLHDVNGLFTFVTVYPLETSEYYWKIVSYVSPEILNAQTHKLRNKLLLLYAVLLVLTCAGAWFLANAQINRKQAEQDLRKHRDNLEELVKDRTSELTVAYERLQKEMSERKQTEARLQLAKDSAEAANKAKSTFLANMGHELRTPLNAIIGYSEILIEDADDLKLKNFASDLQKIETSGKHLLSLINDILDISKIEVGRIKLHLETFDVRPLIDEVVGTIRPLAEKNTNTLEVHYASNLDTMRADPDKARLAISNLLNNACKFTEQGTITLNVTREAVNGDNWLIFSVSDTGIGIGPEEKEELFQPFTQADSSSTRKLEGAGLGLAISKRFCQMMGGDITVKSELGKGSTFTMRLPVNGG